VDDLNRLRQIYPNDMFEALMKHTAIDPATGKAVANDPTREYIFKYVPRIRCPDCLVSRPWVPADLNNHADCE
jgi:hypothetical protein